MEIQILLSDFLGFYRFYDCISKIFPSHWNLQILKISIDIRCGFRKRPDFLETFDNKWTMVNCKWWEMRYVKELY